MRLVFMYMAQHQGEEGTNTPWKRDRLSDHHYVRQFNTEGYYWKLRRMLETGIVKEVLMLIESVRSTGKFEFMPNFYGYVLPEMWQAREFIRPGDIIWCRGGFRSWFNFLNWCKEEKLWTMLYGANTGRERWKFWDIIFNDIYDIPKQLDRYERFWFPYQKATNPEFFKPLKDVPPIYDVCIGASHIHDKKGQWIFVNALIAYKERYGKNLKCILPGGMMHGVNTNQIVGRIKDHKLDVVLPGGIPRKRMIEVYNQSRSFVKLGGGGQNDRGPLEAMACGTPVILGGNTVHRHARFISECPYNHVTTYPSDLAPLAEEINDFLYSPHPSKEDVHACFQKHYGVENVILPNMSALFNLFRAYSTPSREAKEELLKRFGESI